jgi:hypothetical protein
MFVVIAFCQDKKTDFNIEKTPKSLTDSAGQKYFPESESLFYGKYLAAMNEPSVMAPLKKEVEHVMRFTYLRTFDDPLVIRVVQKGDVFTARAVKLEMKRGYKPGKILHDKTWKLAEADKKLVLSLFKQKDFWKPLNATEQEVNMGLDGSSWIFEVHDKTGYRIIDVWSPESSTFSDKELKELGIDKSKVRDFMVYHKTGNKLLKIGGLLPAPQDNY